MEKQQFEYEILSLAITEQGIKPIGKGKFTGAILNNSNFKIYILKEDKTYLYVGKTKQGIGTKFGQGFRAYKKDREGNREAGYGGYKWIKQFINSGRILQLFVFNLGEFYSQNNAEAIEAEIVFKIRQQFKRWPECQNEIHFFNEFKNASEEAEKILDITK